MSVTVDLCMCVHVEVPVFLLTDSIEANVESAEVHVDRGAVQLQKAVYYQVRQRGWRSELKDYMERLDF